MPYYDRRCVPVHKAPAGNKGPRVILVAEAPGRQEAQARIPLFGPQGGNFYRALIKAQVAWAVRWAMKRPLFRYPVKASAKEYAKKTRAKVRHRLRDRSLWLSLRACYVACTNSYPYWPKSSPSADDFVDPADEAVCSPKNITRLKNEVNLVGASVLVISGEFACLACTGKRPADIGAQEGTELKGATKKAIERRLNKPFEHIWYLGHPRRWSTNQVNITAMKKIAQQAGWKLLP